ncbi:MAG TPA: TlyA family RNA methyltransferase [Firmicutes bacterium]|nr:TlyA family RNA methyltransferase [Bacillota bacterium]
MADKLRLDVAMVERGLCESRERAKALIMAGEVFVDGDRCDKAGAAVRPESEIDVRGKRLRYVSRGGLKLEKAIDLYGLDLSGCVCMDVGASTGGFTDCMLQNGAEKVYAIDVGYGQFAWSLRMNPKVVNLERTNFRYLTQEQVPELIDFASVDVSFISLTIILPVLYRFLKENGQAVILVKPQFEAGKGKVGKKGVVREESIHCEVVQKILSFCGEIGFSVSGIDFSPIKGPEGNIEYLFYIRKSTETTTLTAEDVNALVRRSHAELNEGKKEPENC